MSYDADVHHRRSIRLPEYDYAGAGAYFVTLCVHDKACLFGAMVDGAMRLNPFGEIVAEEWTRSANIRHELELDVFMVMPNHVHGIVFIKERRGDRQVALDPMAAPTSSAPNCADGRFVQPAGDLPVAPTGAGRPCGPAKRSLGAFVAGFKAASGRRINLLRGTPGAAVWQRNYFERIVRNENELLGIREYIAANPALWDSDQENPLGAAHQEQSDLRRRL